MQQSRSSNMGFSMVELLAIIIVIGILATVAVSVYNGSKDNSKDAAAKSALATALTNYKSIYAGDETYQNLHVTVYNNDTSQNPAYMQMPGENSLQVTNGWPGLSGNGFSTDMNTAANASANPNKIMQVGWNQQIMFCNKSKSGKSYCIVDSRITGDPAGATSWNFPMGTFYGKAAAGQTPFDAFAAAFNYRKSW